MSAHQREFSRSGLAWASCSSSQPVTSILGPAAIAWLLILEIFDRNSMRITRWPSHITTPRLPAETSNTTSVDATRPGGRCYCLPVSWGFRRLGTLLPGVDRRGIGNASASAQVTGSEPCRVKIVKAFEFMLLTSAPGRIRPALVAPERVAVQAPDLRKHARRCPVRARIGHSRVRSAGSAAEQCGLWRRRATWSRPEDHPLLDSGRSYRLRLRCAGKRGLAIRRRCGRDVGLVCGAVGP
jgi:hypothetical protein